MVVTALTDRDKELLAMRPIASNFPVRFASGAQWNSFGGDCEKCGKPIPSERLRGLVTRPLARVAVVEAAGVCAGCGLLTRFLYRLHDDLRITGMRHGKWRQWSARPPWWMARLKAIRRRIRI